MLWCCRTLKGSTPLEWVRFLHDTKDSSGCWISVERFSLAHEPGVCNPGSPSTEFDEYLHQACATQEAYQQNWWVIMSACFCNSGSMPSRVAENGSRHDSEDTPFFIWTYNGDEFMYNATKRIITFQFHMSATSGFCFPRLARFCWKQSSHHQA